MKFFDPNNPNEKKKMIAAAALGLVALLVLGYVLFGGGSSKPANNGNQIARTSPTPRPPSGTANVDDRPPNECGECKEVNYSGGVPAVSDPNRNIFAFFIPTPTPPKPVIVQTPTPTPSPPMTANSLSPSNVYARTPTDFSLQVSGDKFTPAVHIFLDGRDLPTRFINAQQLFATVPASFISNPGTKTVIVQTPDRQLYSNQIMLNVQQPPVPNFTYVGLIAKPHANDTAVLQDKSNKELLNVQRGDAVGSRFKVVSISDREVKLIDATLKITHTIPFSTDQASGGGYRPPVRTVDDEP